MKIRARLLTDEDNETGISFDVEGIPSSYIGIVVMDDLRKKLNGYDD